MNFLDKQTVDGLNKFLHSEVFGVEVLWIIIAAVVLLVLFSIFAARKRKKNPYSYPNLLKTFEEKWEGEFDPGGKCDPEKEWFHIKMLLSIAHYMESKDLAPLICAKKEYNEKEFVIWQNFLTSLPLKRGKGNLLEEFNSPTKEKKES